MDWLLSALPDDLATNGLRLVAAALLGALMGLEREALRRPAGLRTYMLVSLAASGFTIIAWKIFEEVFRMGVAADLNVNADPIRIIQAVTGGVAFLGAGAIIQNHRNVHGITTGAGMWLAGAVGTASGRGYFPIAVVMTVIALFILAVLRRLERRWQKEDGDSGEGSAR
jgi:putative Mg2+ transporter-C (MgtC) family protein